MKPWLVALTGGIGSGKTAASEIFASLGVPIVDLDVISRALTMPGGLAVPALQKAFGKDAISASGALDRARMRELAFSDPEVKDKLEAILHPLIAKVAYEEVMRNEQALYVIVVHPLLAEYPGRFGHFDRVLVIDCDEATQIKRVMARSKLSREAVVNILQNQALRDDRKAFADEVILNEGTLEDLELEVKRIHAYYETLARQELRRNKED